MHTAAAALVTSAVVACGGQTVTVDTTDHGPSHPAITLAADSPTSVASRWRDGCPLDDLAGHPTVWLLRSGADGTELYLPSPDGRHITSLPGPVSCGWPHTTADRDALAQELATVPASERWKWGDEHR